jgi:pSer/pThr/pTyr-binding forkhead associated (FHA) protein
VSQLSIRRNGRLEGIFSLPDRPVVIGRSDGVDIQLLDAKVSRRHAVIRQSVAGFMIQDLGTKNGTFVNKEAVEKSLLFHGDTVVIGNYTLQFQEREVTEELGTDFIDTLGGGKGSLKVPPGLRDAPNPRAPTRADATSPRPGRASVEVSARRGSTGEHRPVSARPASAPVTSPGGRAPAPARAPARPQTPGSFTDSTNVPLIEGLAPDDADGPSQSSGSLDFSIPDLDAESLVSQEPPRTPRRTPR